MLIVKPYGRTVVARDADGSLRRSVLPRGGSGEYVDTEDFAHSHEELVVAQWISVIDKIARKPASGQGATDEQRAFRHRIGDAAWARLETCNRLPGIADPVRRAYMLKLWTWKIAPYGAAQYRRRSGRSPSAKGHWYDRFAGAATRVADADVDAIAEKIEQHLYHGERQAHGDRPRSAGTISRRARSITSNVATPPKPAYLGGCGVAWTVQDEQRYAAAGDVALGIRNRAVLRERGEDPRGLRRVSTDVAAQILYIQFARLFRAREGGAMTIGEARLTEPGLYALHSAIKDSYKRLLVRKQPARSKETHLSTSPRLLSSTLPETMEALFALVDAKRRNRDLNSLVRLGKIIHYEASMGEDDNPAAIGRNWPLAVDQSFYWTSEGQLEIKRNEAFVRIWRGALALASRTLTDWADHRGAIGSDILMTEQRERAIGSDFDPDMHARKLDLLFGQRAVLFKFADRDDQRALLKFALQGVYDLRNKAFHFAGYGGFTEALSACCSSAAPEILAALRQLWQLDMRARSGRVVTTARAAQFDYFWTQEEIGRLLKPDAVRSSAPLALPRLMRVLKRATDALSDLDEGVGSFEKPSGRAMQDPATLCRHESLKLLYEGGFRDWFYGRDASLVNDLIDRAIGRATDAARTLNARGDPDVGEVIVARAAKLGRLQPGENVSHFFFRLAAETASELRVQNGYESDSTAARDQAKYIENVKLDVTALAFAAFLREHGFDFVLALQPGSPGADAPICEIVPAFEEVDAVVDDWQVALYFLLHLIPVDDAVRLLHQIWRWETLEFRSGVGPRSSVAHVQAALVLYRDMHDAKFEGDFRLAGTEPFRHFFEQGADFDRVFPSRAADELRASKRGLREIMRFGHFALLKDIFQQHRIAGWQASEFVRVTAPGSDGTSEIAELQAERESLHERWARRDPSFGALERRRYQMILVRIVRHRHLLAHVTLTNHVRVHRLLVAICARLLDFSGLWERDLYFATLALIHQEGNAPRQLFAERALRSLGRGQIIDALRLATLPEPIAAALTVHFSGVWKAASRAVKLRNRLAHFNMLRPGSTPDLTRAVNETRELLRHDRKLRNAVSQSVRELLRREGLEIAWELEPGGHDLGAARIMTRCAIHLRSAEIVEDLHGENLVAMAAALFGNCRPVPPTANVPRHGAAASPDRAAHMPQLNADRGVRGLPK